MAGRSKGLLQFVFSVFSTSINVYRSKAMRGPSRKVQGPVTEADLARKEGRDYEPAPVLLECIKSDRQKSVASTNGTKPRKVLAAKK